MEVFLKWEDMSSQSKLPVNLTKHYCLFTGDAGKSEPDWNSRSTSRSPNH